MWELDGEYLSGSCFDEAEAYTGSYYQKNYEYECTLNPQCGFNHLIHFRLQGGIRSYAFGWYGENKLALLKRHKDYMVLDQKEDSLAFHTDTTLKVRVKDNKMSTYVNGEKIFECEDEEFTYGQIGVSVRDGSHCHFKNVQVRSI